MVSRPGGEQLNACFSCGGCSGACPVSQAIPDYDPRKFIHMARLGLEEELLGSDLVWFCSGCRNCVDICPQDVSFADIMQVFLQLSLDKGYARAEEKVEKGKVAEVKKELCVSCLTCVRVCPWDIPIIDSDGYASIDADKCRGCGICVIECPAKAINLPMGEDEKLLLTGNE